MTCEEKNRIRCDKRGDKIADKATGFTRLVNMFKHVLADSHEDLSASSALLYNETNSYRDQLLRVEEWRNRAIDDIRRRIA